MVAQNNKTQNPWLVLTGVFILLFLISIDYTAVTIALVKISEDFQTKLGDIQWAISGYVLTWAALVVPSGKMADIYGKRRVFLIGVCIFLLASVICGVAPNAFIFIIARIFQGIGGALFCTPIYTLTFSVFSEEKQGFAIGMLSLAAGLGLAIGPSLAGFMINYLGWRWIFFINIPLCIACIYVVRNYVPRDIFEREFQPFDYVGGFLLALTLTLLMYTLNKIELFDTRPLQSWIILAIAFITLLIFTIQQARVENPLIPYSLFKNKQYISALIGFTIYEINFGTFFVLQGLYLQNVLKYSPMEAGNIFLAFTIALGALSPIGGSLIDKLGARWPICLGLCLSGLSFILATFLSEKTSLVYILTLMFLNGVGMGISFPAFNSLIMKIVDQEHLSIGSSVFIMGSTLGNTIGVVGSTSLLVILGAPQIATISSQNNTKVVECLTRLLSSAYPDFDALQAFDENSKMELIAMVNHIFVKSMSSIMLISVFLTLIVFILSYIWIRYRPPSYASALSKALFAKQLLSS